MSEKIKSKIGEELYNKILESGLKAEDIDIVTDGSYIPRARFNEVNGKLKATEAKIDDYEKQITDTKNLLKDNEDFKGKYSELNEKYKNDLALKDKEILNTSKRYLIEQSLREAGAKHTSLLMKDIDLESITIDNDKLLGMDKITEDLKTNYSDLFVVKNTNNNLQGSNNTNTDNDINNDPDSEDWGDLLKDL